jgi:hypothetical protein
VTLILYNTKESKRAFETVTKLKYFGRSITITNLFIRELRAD